MINLHSWKRHPNNKKRTTPRYRPYYENRHFTRLSRQFLFVVIQRQSRTTSFLALQGDFSVGFRARHFVGEFTPTFIFSTLFCKHLIRNNRAANIRQPTANTVHFISRNVRELGWPKKCKMYSVKKKRLLDTFTFFSFIDYIFLRIWSVGHETKKNKINGKHTYLYVTCRWSGCMQILYEKRASQVKLALVRFLFWWDRDNTAFVGI